MKAATYLSSPSVLLGLGVGALMYVSYGLAHVHVHWLLHSVLLEAGQQT